MSPSGSTIVPRELYKLAIGGGLVFWATTVATSLLPIAAEYRSAFAQRSWNVQTVWACSLLVGMIIGCCVSYALLRFYVKLPTASPIGKSALLGLIALVIAVLLIDVPQSLGLLAPGNARHYFLVGVLLNVPRFLFLGVAIGYLYKRLRGSA